MAQLSLIMNPHQPGTLRSNIVQIPKNDGNSMAVTTQGCKPTIDPRILYGLENVIRGDDEVVEISGELEDKTGKEAEVPKKVSPMPRPPPPF